MKHTRFMGAVLAAALVLVGCGSGESSSAGESAEVTYEKFEVVTMESEGGYDCDTMDKLLERSTAVVIGEYVGEPVTEGDAPRPGVTRARFRVEQVLDGSITATGDNEVTIAARYEFREQDGAKTLVTESGLSPAHPGDRWVLFLNYDEEQGCCYITGDVSGRYPLPESLDKPDGYGYKNGLLEPERFNYEICKQVYERYRLEE